MEELLFVLMMIVILFILLLFIQKFLNRKLCALCGAVMMSWIVLFILYKAGIFSNLLLMALLIGESTVGFYYLVEQKVPRQLTLFRLPFLLTLIIMGVLILELGSGNIPSSVSSIWFVTAIWFLFIFIYLFRHHQKLRHITKKMINCCKRW